MLKFLSNFFKTLLKLPLPLRERGGVRGKTVINSNEREKTMTLLARITIEDENGNVRIPWLPDASDTVKGVTIVDNALNASSSNPVQNGVITSALNGKADANHTHNGYLTAHQDITGKQDVSNLVTSLSAQSTDAQYPSAKCVYDLIGSVETLLQNV